MAFTDWFKFRASDPAWRPICPKCKPNLMIKNRNFFECLLCGSRLSSTGLRLAPNKDTAKAKKETA